MLQPTPQQTSWIEFAGRFGFVTRGAIYGLVGILVIQATSMGKASGTDPRGAVSEIGSQPFGSVLLWVVALGLICYALLRLLIAVRDPENLGSSPKAKGKRIAYAISGVVHGFLAYFAARLASGMNSDPATEKQNSAALLSLPGGAFILGFVGAVVVAVGIAHFVQAYKKTFMRHYGSAAVSAQKCRAFTFIGQFGLAARGITFGIIGWFLIKAAYDQSAREVVGPKGALSELAQQPYGAVLLGVVALGFVAFGIHSVTLGIYGKVRV